LAFVPALACRSTDAPVVEPAAPLESPPVFIEAPAPVATTSS